MAEPSLVVRIAASLSEFKANLAEGRNQIEATTAGMKRLESSFSGDRIIRSAHDTASAVQSIGGASKLTEAEQARVNRTVQAALDKYAALGKQAPDALKSLARETANATDKTSLLGRGLQLALGAVTLQAAITLGKKILDTADHIQKLSDQTGIGTEAIQKLGFVAQQSGNTFDEVANAISFMQKNLGSGNEGAIGALNRLNIDITRFMNLSPDKQFEEIATEVGKIEDPMMRAEVATKLFGRAGTQLLPTLTSDFEALAEAASVMSDETVRSLDAAGDNIDRFVNGATVAIGNLVGALMEIDRRTSAMVASGNSFDAWLKGLMGVREADKELVKVKGTIGGLPEPAKALTMSFEEIDRVSRKLTLSAKDSADALDRHVKPAIKKTTDLQSRSIQETARLTEAAEQWAHVNGAVLAPSIKQVNATLEEQEPLQAKQLLIWDQYKSGVKEASLKTDTFKDSMKEIPGIVTSSFTGGGGLTGAIQGVATHTANAAVASSGLGTALGAAGIAGTVALGAMTMGIGAAAVGIGMLISKWAGVSKEIKEARKNLEEVQNQLINVATETQRQEAGNRRWALDVIVVRDAFLKLGKTAEEAERVVAAMWDTDNPKRSAEAIRQVSDAFKQLEADNDRLTKAMEKYGISIADMGQKFKQTQINTTAGEFIEDFRVLAAAVDDVNIVMERMAPEVNKFINATMAMGGQVPREMQGIISKMVEMGLLTNETGEKFTELGQIPFAASLTDSLNAIADRLDRLIHRIGIDLPRAISSIPDGSFRINGEVNMPDIPGMEVPEFMHGSNGVRDFGSGTLAMLHGREAVIPENQLRSGGASMGGDVSAALDRMMDRLEHVLPLRMRDALQGAV